MTFNKFNSQKKSIFVLKQILQKIKSEEYEIGDHIPTESELVEKIGVSRTSVREALAALRLVGVLTSKPGQGTFVSRKLSKHSDGLKDEAIVLLQDNITPSEIFEAREIIAGPIAALATRKINDSDLKTIKETLDKMTIATESGNKEKYLALNKNFHFSLAKSTHNRALTSIMGVIFSHMDEDLWKEERESYFDEDDRELSRMLQIHKDIYVALKEKDKETLIEELDNHFEYVKKGS